MQQSLAENTYRSELLAYPGPWSFCLEKARILVGDQDAVDLGDPDRAISTSR